MRVHAIIIFCLATLALSSTTLGDETGVSSAEPVRDIEAMLAAAQRGAENGYDSSALARVDEILRLSPREVHAHRIKIQLMARSGDLSGALRAFERSPPSPGDAELLTCLAREELREIRDGGPRDLRLAAALALCGCDSVALASMLERCAWAGGPRSRDAMLEVIGRRDRSLVPVLRTVLASGDEGLRPFALAGLLALESCDAAPDLLGAMASSDPHEAADAIAAVEVAGLADLLPQVRSSALRSDEAAIAAYGALSRASPERSERLHALRALERESSVSGPHWRFAYAVRQLGRSPDAEAGAILGRIRGRVQKDWRKRLVECALARRGRTEVVEGLVRRIGAGEDGSLEIATALSCIGPGWHLGRLRELAEDPRRAVRISATIAFLGAGGLSDDPRLVSRCMARSRDEDDEEARLAVAKAINSQGLAAAELARPVLARAFDIEARFQRSRDPNATELCREAVRQALVANEETFAVEVAAPGLVVVALRADLGQGRVERIGSMLRGFAYVASLSICTGRGSSSEGVGSSP